MKTVCVQLAFLSMAEQSAEVINALVCQVYAPDEETYVGRVTKQWSGLGKELFTDADNFGISFPLDLDVNVKATLLGAVFLLVSN